MSYSSLGRFSRAALWAVLITAFGLAFGRQVLGTAFLNLGAQAVLQAAAACTSDGLDSVPLDKDIQVGCSPASRQISVQAAAFLAQGLQLNPGSSSGYYNLALSNLLSGQAAQAEQDLSHAVQLDPANRIAQFTLGRWQSAAGNPAQALTAWQGAQAAPFFLLQGRTAYNQADYALAEQFLSLAVQIDPRLGDAYQSLGDAQRKLGKGLEASRNFRTAGDLQLAGSAQQYALWGLADWLAGDRSRATDEYRQAITLNPHDGGYYFDLGVIFLEMNDPGQAIQTLLAGIQAAPENYFHRRLLGDIYRGQNNCPEAIRWYQQAILIDPLRFDPWSGIGVCQYILGDYGAAVENLRSAQDRGDQDADLDYYLGQSYTNLGELTEARQALEQAVQLNPLDPRYHLALGDLLAAAGDPNAALAEYKAALQADPNNSVAAERITRLGH